MRDILQAVKRPGHARADVAFALDISYDYIQSIRLAQALIEAGGQLHVPRKLKRHFSQIRKVFREAPGLGVEHLPVLQGVTIDHATPATSVGRLTRPLIFPRYMFAHLRGRWPDARPWRFTFAGLLTKQRIVAINHWLVSRMDDSRPIVPPRRWVAALQRVTARLGIGTSRTIERANVLLWSSDKGRHFPLKSWDRDYFSLLLNSQFVLCPSGDYVWSYRFFEAIVCGALPVVEERCPLYDGFRFFTMAEATGEMAWSLETAEFNYALAIERLSVPRDELAAELRSLLDASRRP